MSDEQRAELVAERDAAIRRLLTRRDTRERRARLAALVIAVNDRIVAELRRPAKRRNGNGGRP